MVNIRFLDDTERESIGFNYIMRNLDVLTPYGLKIKKNIKAYKKDQKDTLIKELNYIETIKESFIENKDYHMKIENVLYKFKDIRKSIQRCERSNVLDEVEIFEIKCFCILIDELIDIYRKIDICIDDINFKLPEKIIDLLDPEKTRIPTFYIYNSYSENLRKIRYRKKEIEQKIFNYMDEEIIYNLKQERLEIVILEEKEELKIKKYLSNEINKFVDDIKINMNSLGKLDFLIGKAKLALKYEAVKPQICDDMNIKIEDSVNPYVKDIVEKKNKKFVPISIDLNSGSTVITGANMGGKSVSLNTIVLNLMLGQMGFFVFCKKAEFPILDFIYFISDDMQSVSKGLSTFGAEICKLKEVIESIKRGDGFVALDEFARGTNPKEGSILVKSVCEYLETFKSISIISTHYDGVIDNNTVHYQVRGLKDIDFDSLKYKIDLNKSKSIQIIQDNMDYRLERVTKDYEVPKDALNISILMGLDRSIVNIAKQYY
ncbi:MutS-related protein [Tepidibacter hydrothermalis]|uniref:DNA mismatch repair proteins mutS family domain-containing protein n=1 Tax=Tepidibacter hydrothermalis TaxID=3036126 RepID=A0ABY8EEU4_9FIRM|nr:hypothetical protein [Tepidibacter hydrothermalis]WFD11465.1 hypothetical protein P4S50_05155 [Tepidibacter hydrothermalis]